MDNKKKESVSNTGPEKDTFSFGSARKASILCPDSGKGYKDTDSGNNHIRKRTDFIRNRFCFSWIKSGSRCRKRYAWKVLQR